MTPHVTPHVGRLIAALRGEMSRAELVDALGLSDRKHFAKTYLQPGLGAGLVRNDAPGQSEEQVAKIPADRFRETGTGFPAGHLMWIPFQTTTLQKSRTSGPKVSLPPPHWERGHPRPHPFAYCEPSGSRPGPALPSAKSVRTLSGKRPLRSASLSSLKASPAYPRARATTSAKLVVVYLPGPDTPRASP